MAVQTLVAEQEMKGPYVKEGDTQFGELVFVAGDNTNGNKIIMGGSGTILFVRNTGAGAGTVSVASSYDRQGRKADISAFSVPADDIVFRLFVPDGWESETGSRALIVTPSATTMELAAVRLD